MTFLKYILFPIILISAFTFAEAQHFISGRVVDSSGTAIAYVNIVDSVSGFGTVSDKDGSFSLKVNKLPAFISFSAVGFLKQNITVNKFNSDNSFDVILYSHDTQIETVNINSINNSLNGQTINNNQLINISGGLGNNVEQVIKMQPGVASGNELSSKYNVRGGSFDENIIYVNGIEIKTPWHVRSGEQEGLSFVNSSLVENVIFSTGGFSAEYGDAMSSVLDVSYLKPDSFALSASLGLMGASVSVQNVVRDKFSFVSGLRYRNSGYLLNSLDVKGEYNPVYTDFQFFSTYKISKKLSAQFTGIVSRNVFDFVPQTRSTTFGTVNDALGMTVYYDGCEKDMYLNMLAGAALKYIDLKHWQLSLTSAFQAAGDNENYDIDAQYYLSSVDVFSGQTSASKDSSLNGGIGESFSHARNSLTSRQYTAKFDAVGFYGNNKFGFGISYRCFDINDRIEEWNLIDSAGFPSLKNSLFAVNHFVNNEYSGYLLYKYLFDCGRAKIALLPSVRYSFCDYASSSALSPRITISTVFPDKSSEYRLSAGRYLQQLSLSELRKEDGSLAGEADVQRSFHIVGGFYKNFYMWQRPFRFTSEIYYKFLRDIVPYTIDNVKITYYADLRSDGYAAGADFKLYGQFVEGLDSWFGFSLLKTSEDVKGDNHGYIPRPNDRRVSTSVYFRDYCPGFDFLSVDISAVYASPLPFGPENSERYQCEYRGDSYLRVDMGVSAYLFKKRLKPGRQFVVGMEIFNLLDVNNTVSYSWISTVSGSQVTQSQYAVPDRLTSRRIDLKISLIF